MSLTSESSGTKPKPPNHPKHKQKTNNHRNKQIRLMSALVLKSKRCRSEDQHRSETGGMNSSQAALSTGRPGQNCTLLRSAHRQEGIPPKVHSVYICMSKLKARVRCKSGSARSMRSKARHNLYQRMRTRQRPCGSFQGDQNRVNSSSRLRGKILVYSCLWLGHSAPGMPVKGQDRSDKGHYSLPAKWSKDPGLARGSRRFRIDTWPLTSAPPIIPLDLQFRFASIATASQDMIQRRLLRRRAKDKRWHREGRSSSKQDTASPSGRGKEHERPGDSVNERNDTEQTWSHRKAGPSISIKAPI